MHLTSLIAVLAGLASVFTNAHTLPYREHPVRTRSAVAFDPSTASLNDFADHALTIAKQRISNSTGSCTPETVTVRKLFENLSGDERIAYTSALNCLMQLPARTPSELVPGAKSRYDDFVTTHMNQTTRIHNTANFLGWHRWFIFEMEQSLRNECNYTGAIPYWDWTRTAKEGFNASEMVDGSATSLSGNGLPIARPAGDRIIINAGAPGAVTLPVGTGGGCVTSGPFANMSVNLGPVGLIVANGTTIGSNDQFAYNPRCLVRDFTDASLQRFANETSIHDLLATDNVWDFETLFQGSAELPELGAHGGGHFAMGGDPGRDVFTSPGEPLFWSHHANVDRVWWMWQMLDSATRVGNTPSAINGTLTMTGEGTGTLTDLQNLGYVKEGVEIELGQLLDNTAGIFCTIYE